MNTHTYQIHCLRNYASSFLMYVIFCILYDLILVFGIKRRCIDKLYTNVVNLTVRVHCQRWNRSNRQSIICRLNCLCIIIAKIHSLTNNNEPITSRSTPRPLCLVCGMHRVHIRTLRIFRDFTSKSYVKHNMSVQSYYHKAYFFGMISLTFLFCNFVKLIITQVYIFLRLLANLFLILSNTFSFVRYMCQST